MKNRDEIIIRYLDGQMNPVEKTDFENELKSSEELRKAFEEYKKVFHSVECAKNIKINEDYAESIIPEFRRRLEKKSSAHFNFRLAYGLTTVIIIALAVLFFSRVSNTDKIMETELVTNNITPNEIETIFNQMSTEDLILAYEFEETNKLDSLYTSYYSREIVDPEYAEENLFALNGIELNEIEDLLSDDEMDFVYNEIINKEFF